MKNKIYRYPNFTPSLGNLTSKFRKEYIDEQIKLNLLPKNSFENEQIMSLVASTDIIDKVYFWQLYSIIGQDPLHILIKTFYENIFNDDSSRIEWFKNGFSEIGDVNYHVKGQKNFWLDVMGGGKLYIGGESKLSFKHRMVQDMMNTKGAELWMNYMKITLHEVKFHFMHDSRIIPCIDSFLNFFMKKYSFEFDYNIYNLLHDKSLSKL